MIDPTTARIRRARTEEWRPVVGYEGIYEVSDQGRVRSLFRRYRRSTPKILKGGYCQRGYHHFVLCKDGERHTHLLHRVVMEAFVGPCPEAMEVCHRNGRRDDCALRNLRYGSPKSNQADRKEHGTHMSGEHAPWSKMSEEDIADIRGSVASGETQVSVAARYGVGQGYISNIITRRIWKEVA